MEKQFERSTMSYFLLSVKVHNAQALPNMNILGTPSIIGIYGAIHKLQRNILKYLELDIEFKEFLIAINSESFFLNLYHPKFSPYHKVYAPKNNFAAASTVDVKSMDFEVILVVKIDNKTHFTLEKVTEKIKSNDFVLEDLRICGGTTESLPKFSIYENLKKVLINIKYPYYFICDGSQLVENILSGDETELEKNTKKSIRRDALDCILALTESGNRQIKNELLAELNVTASGKENYFPLNIGYVTLEKNPFKRMQNSYEHFFVESLIGLGKSYPTSYVKNVFFNGGEESINEFFWKYENRLNKNNYSFFYCKNN